MAQMRMDQLNILRDEEQPVDRSSVLQINEYFDDMYLSKSEKEERKDLAKSLYIILSAILTIIKANNVLGNEHDVEYYENYIVDNFSAVFDVLFGTNRYRSQIETFASEFVYTTMKHIDDPYFTSDDRAIVNAEAQSNGVYNRNQFEEAVRMGKTTKQWVTMHDQRVRKTHEAVDGNKVEINKPFIVGGSELMFPTDQSLGASYKEVCGCRCVCTYGE
jgi:hypothetical protein